MASPTEFPDSFLEPWKRLLEDKSREQANDFPNHHVADVDSLITTSSPKSLYVGTGYSIFTRALLPAILEAKTSVHFVTCYWAESPSRHSLRQTLVQLATARSRSPHLQPLHISIGFSSSGALQKLLHTASRNGHVYPPSQWATLGLPDEVTLRKGGIVMTVKSLFFTPLSVMHPKYVIVDGKTAFVPSCNVSWERWFEGCVELEGDIVGKLLAFHDRVWTAGSAGASSTDNGMDADVDARTTEHESNSASETHDTSPTQSIRFTSDSPVPTIFLPSPHHRNPGFSVFPLLAQSKPPMTPLNAALLTLFANAQRSITILTPNVTSWPVLDALLDALARGVDVKIRTSKNMMLVEQLVTAGTTTSLCLGTFVKKYQAILNRHRSSDHEVQRVPPGKLEIYYYKPIEWRRSEQDEPVLSHFKMTLVDGEYLVLGSGNMDRASWWTSQELGVLFYVPGFDGHALWEGILDKRTEVVFRSKDSQNL